MDLARYRASLVLALLLCGGSTADVRAAIDACTPGTIMCGETCQGSIGQASVVEHYAFVAQAGDTIVVALAATPGSQLNPCWRLAKGGQVLDDDECMWRSGEVSLPESGTYDLQVYDFYGDGVGGYLLTFETVGATFNLASNGPPTPTCQRGQDGTQPLSCGQTTLGAIDPANEIDTYSFDGRAGGDGLINIVGTGDSNACWDLYSPTGTPLTSGCDFNIPTTVELPTAGVFTLVVTTVNGSASGPYHLSLDCSFCVADGPSFPSVGCRLSALLTRIQADDQGEPIRMKLVTAAGSAHGRSVDASARCVQGDTKNAKRMLKKSLGFLKQFAMRLDTQRAQEVLDAGLLESLRAAAASLKVDVRSLRSSLSCPT